MPSRRAATVNEPARQFARARVSARGGVLSAWRRALLRLCLTVLLWPPGDAALAEPSAPPATADSVELSAAERAWLAARHTVRARVADYPPYMLTKPQPSGIAIEHLAAVARRFGFAVEFLPDHIGFAAAVQDVGGPRRHFDLLPTFTRTPEREKQFAITDDYLSAPWVLYARRDDPYIMGLESLDGRSVAGESGYVITSRIKADYPAIHVREVANSQAALLAVATGEADAYVGNLATANYLIKEQHLDNLVVAAATPYGINTQAMAVRQDWPELATLINKGIAAMAPAERNAIRQHWGVVEFKPQRDYTLVWQIVAAATLILLLFVYWNRRLAGEVARRTRAERSLRESAQQLSAERDQLERRVSERTAHLSEALEFNATILLNSPLPMGIYSADGQCVLANEAYAEFVGATRAALLAQNFNDSDSWRQTSLHADCMTALQQHVSRQNEAHTITSFGKDIWFAYRIIPRQLKGQDHLLIQFFDLTERKAQQLELERRVAARTAELATARAEAEAASAVKTRFMTNVSHAMRTPMNGILGLAEIGRRAVGKATDDVIGGYFDGIRDAGKRLHKLTESLLSLAQDAWNEQSGIAVTDLQPIEPQALAIQSIAALEKVAASRQQRIVLEPTATISTILGDEARLRQVLEHLLSNALRYSPEQSTVSVRIDDAPTPSGPPNRISIQVIDQGCGIPERELGAIFEPFYESSRTATGAGGSGLGLALSRSIIRRHQGTLSAANRPSGGALFEIILPQFPDQ